MLEGLRPRVDKATPRVSDRGGVLAAARHALDLHGWLAEPDFDQEGEVQRAARALAAAPGATPLLAAACGMHHWLADGNARAPMRAALVRHWTRHGLLQAPVPLTGPAALRGAADDHARWGIEAWAPAFLHAVAGEAEAALALLTGLEQAWRAARRAVASVAGRRRTSRAAAAVDVLAAAPLVSATSLAAALGMAVKNATALLDAFCRDGVAIEVTHRCKRRLFGLAGLAPLRAEVAPPHRPVPGRGRGRPSRAVAAAANAPALPSAPMPPMSPLERWSYDYGELERAMAAIDETLRRTRRDLGQPAGHLTRGCEDISGA
ncbi:MAG TPA: hypothetical protein VGC42_26310 [Kofleriaceae bacterium]